MLVALLAAALAAEPPPAAPLAPTSPLATRIRDPAVIRAAVKAVASTESRKESVLSGDASMGLGTAFDAARVPGCLQPDALRHQPASIGPVAIGGIYALPFLAAAILRGKCN